MKIINVNNINEAYNFIYNAINSGVQNGLHITCTQIKDKMIQNSKNTKTGRVYKIRFDNGRVKYHQASSSSETSARITGKKNKGIKFKVAGLNADIGIDKSVDYAPFVETGTKKMAARRDTVVAGKEVVEKNLENNLINSIKIKFFE